MAKQKINVSAKQIEAWIPRTLDEVCGNPELVDFLRRCQENREPQEDISLLVLGEPGTGKTSTLICYLRNRWDAQLGYEDQNGIFGAIRGQKFDFVRINGATITEARLNEVVESMLADRATEHGVVFVDELGELFHRGLEQKIRPLFERTEITVYATAQDFHAKKKRGDTEEEDRNRYLSILSRFRKKIYTMPPTEEELVRFLRARLREFGIGDDGDATIRLLAQKAEGVVRRAMEGLVAAASEPEGRLTRQLVAGLILDPLII